VRGRTATASSELPQGLFGKYGLAWAVTVRGHLTAALSEVSVDQGHNALERVLVEAVRVFDSLGVTTSFVADAIAVLGFGPVGVRARARR
jgi:hypothetical protein